MLIKKTKIPIASIILIGFLPSFLKKIIYRIKGYKIGKNVSFGIGNVIIGSEVSIEDNAKFGFISVIRGKKIEIGRYVTIGSLTMIDTEQIIIGEDSRINENVIIGGIKTPESMIKIGKRSIIMEYSFINPTKPIIIGDDSGIGGHCLLFTHGSWLNQLDGFPVTFAPITIGDRVWLPWRVFVMPGVNIGNEVVIGANSLISSNLPSNVMAAGSPAKIIKENYPPKISDEKRTEIFISIVNEFIKYLRYNNIEAILNNKEFGFVLSIKKENKVLEMVFINENSTLSSLPKKIDLLIIDSEKEFSISTYMTLNLKTKSRFGKSNLGEEFTKYLSRHGIRFNRID